MVLQEDFRVILHKECSQLDSPIRGEEEDAAIPTGMNKMTEGCEFGSSGSVQPP